MQAARRGTDTLARLARLESRVLFLLLSEYLLFGLAERLFEALGTYAWIRAAGVKDPSFNIAPK